MNRTLTTEGIHDGNRWKVGGKGGLNWLKPDSRCLNTLYRFKGIFRGLSPMGHHFQMGN
jgi:hypothetical protein